MGTLFCLCKSKVLFPLPLRYPCKWYHVAFKCHGDASLGHWPHTTSNANLLSAVFANTPTTHTCTRDSHFAYNIILNYAMVYINYDKIKYNFALSRQNKVQPFVFAAVKVVKIFDICKYFFAKSSIWRNRNVDWCYRSRIQKNSPNSQGKGWGEVS